MQSMAFKNPASPVQKPRVSYSHVAFTMADTNGQKRRGLGVEEEEHEEEECFRDRGIESRFDG